MGAYIQTKQNFFCHLIAFLSFRKQGNTRAREKRERGMMWTQYSPVIASDWERGSLNEGAYKWGEELLLYLEVYGKPSAIQSNPITGIPSEFELSRFYFNPLYSSCYKLTSCLLNNSTGKHCTLVLYSQVIGQWLAAYHNIYSFRRRLISWLQFEWKKSQLCWTKVTSSEASKNTPKSMHGKQKKGG